MTSPLGARPPRIPAMSRSLVIALVVLLTLAAPHAVADTVVLVAKSATILETKANGRAWDFAPGLKKALPDPYVKAWVYDTDGAQADYGETAVEWDTLNPVWNKDLAK